MEWKFVEMRDGVSHWHSEGNLGFTETEGFSVCLE